jgi:threonine dehydrogenase-like Zn-dependent dehydrogenase
VPDSLPDDVAVLTEIFAVTHSLERAAQVPRPSGFRPGDSVAVLGVGALGQAHAIKAQLMGAGRVFAVDPSRKRLDVAARVAGAEPADPDELRDVDLVVNATGFPGSFAKAIKVVRDGGTIIEVGAFVNMGDETFNPAVICGRNLTLMGIGGEDLLAYDRTLALLARHAGAIPFAEMVSHRFPVSDAPAAMETALDAERSAKVLITSG